MHEQPLVRQVSRCAPRFVGLTVAYIGSWPQFKKHSGRLRAMNNGAECAGPRFVN